MFVMILRVDRTSSELKGMVVILELLGWFVKVREASCHLCDVSLIENDVLHVCDWLYCDDRKLSCMVNLVGMYDCYILDYFINYEMLLFDFVVIGRY